MNQRLFSYILRYDDGAAPNPFWGTCTLAICKPDIRRTANVGDWIVGTGSKNSRLKDGNTYNLSDSVVYAMKVTEKLSLEDYDKFCRKSLVKKIPQWNSKDYRLKVSDCIYDYSESATTKLRQSVHNLDSMKRDLGGKSVLLSNHFFYFGEEARILPRELKNIIRRGQKHLVFDDSETIKRFEVWVSKYIKNKIYAQPQLKFEFAICSSEEQIEKCSARHLEG